MALQRSFESHRPKGRRLFCDPTPTPFCDPPLRALATASAIPGLRRLAVASTTPSEDPVATISHRPHQGDRRRHAEATTDGTQCVLLGAGYDTRAYRLPALKTTESSRSTTRLRKQPNI